jgi:hypothetical protein
VDVKKGWARAASSQYEAFLGLDQKDKEEHCAEHNTVPAEDNKGVCLDVAQQPPNHDERNHRRADESEKHHAPALRGAPNRRVMEGLKNLEPPCRKHRRNPDEKGKLGRRRPAQAEHQHEENCRS